MSRKLVVPGIYEHFKGSKYITIGTSKPISSKQINRLMINDKLDYMSYGMHTELSDEVDLFISQGKIYHPEEVESEELVIYKPISVARKMYLRPLKMFHSEVDHEKYPGVKQKYRLELIK